MNSLEIPTESLDLSHLIPDNVEKNMKPRKTDVPIITSPSFLTIAYNNIKMKEPNGIVPRQKNYRMSKRNISPLRGLGPLILKKVPSPNNLQVEENKTSYLRNKAALIATRLFTEYKNRIFYRNSKNLNEAHLKIIDDKANYLTEIPSFFTKFLESRKQKGLGIRLMSYFVNHVEAFSSRGKLSTYFQKVPLYDANNPFKIVWDLILMSLTLARLFTYSIEKCFFIDLDIEALGFTLIILQLFNIIITLNTNYYCKGEQITDRRKILRNFVKNCLITEVIPSIGLSFTYFSRSYSLMHDMNLILILRLAFSGELGERIKALIIKNVKMESLYTLIILIVKILIWGHLIACIWHYVGMKSIEGNSEAINWLKTKGVADKPWETRYLYSFYWAVTTMLTVGYGDVTPTNEQEMMFNVAAMFLGCGMFGYSMNSIGEILKFSGYDERLLKDQMKLVNNMMEGKNLPSETQIKIRKYMEFVWRQEQKENPEQEKLIMSRLTSRLRSEIYLNTNVRLLKSVPALKSFSEKTLISLSSFMKKVRFSPEEHIYKEGDFEELPLYFVVDGSLELVKEKDGMKSRTIRPWKTYKKGDYFGVHEFFTGKSRSLAVVSVDFSTLFQISRRDFLYVLQKNKEEQEKFSRIKDFELLYRKFDQYKIQCSFCNREDHPLNECKFFSYSPPKEFVLGKYLERKKKFRKNFKRTNRNKENALLEKARNISSLGDFNLVYHDDEDLRELIEFYELIFITSEKENERSLKEIESPLLLRIKPDEEAEESKEEESMEEEDIKKQGVPTSLTYIDTQAPRTHKNLTVLITKSQRNQSRPGSIIKASINEAKSEKRNRSEKQDLMSNVKTKEQNMVKKKAPEDQIIFEKLKEYRFYFPRNNASFVVYLCNKKEKSLKTDAIYIFKSNLE